MDYAVTVSKFSELFSYAATVFFAGINSAKLFCGRENTARDNSAVAWRKISHVRGVAQSFHSFALGETADAVTGILSCSRFVNTSTDLPNFLTVHIHSTTCGSTQDELCVLQCRGLFVFAVVVALAFATRVPAHVRLLFFVADV